MSYRSFVGLEIHIQLATRTKVFCGCRARFGEEPNTNICPVCAGYPGALPALNEEAMRLGYVVARALNCDLSPACEFERKNYFYPDLPKNYQISQFTRPLGTDGFIDLEFRRNKRRVKIRECHLEEDAGKMIHAGDQSLLDYNRAGTPLLEIVTDPDLEIGEEAEVLLQEFRRLVRYLGVCDGNMEEGSLRCDANVSVNLEGQGLGTKVEIKNMNSFRFVRKALNYEIDRQRDIIERGGTIVQETRLWNENRDVSESMRVKESSNDYRYFPEPDMPPFVATPEFLTSVDDLIVELPIARTARFISDYRLTDAQASFLCEERQIADYFEHAVRLGASPAAAAVWLMGDVQKLLNRSGTRLSDSPLTPDRFAQLLTLLDAGRIHGKIAKQTLEAVFDDDSDPQEIIVARSWEQITDPAAIDAIVEDVLRSNPQAVAQLRAGDARPKGFLVGRIMQATNGRAEPRLVQDILARKLDVQFVQVLSFGGAISGRRRDDGVIVAGELSQLIEQVVRDASLPADIRYEAVELGRFLSEEVTPNDWAGLIGAVDAHLSVGDAAGIVVTTGTDTLAYTAALLHWLFGGADVPIVLTASAMTGDAPESTHNFKEAVRIAMSGGAGGGAAVDSPGAVSVVFDRVAYPALNLKFERIPARAASTDAPSVVTPAAATPAAATPPAFRTWNPDAVRDAAGRSLYELQSLTVDAIAERLEAAVTKSFIAKVFPGMQASSLTALIDSGTRFFVLELYDSGTANVGETPFGLRRALEYGRRAGALFLCTSQQEGNVDFSPYITSHELWREGAVPMGPLTTESVYGLLLAVLLTSDSWDPEAVSQAMERAQ
ncbi:MAG: Asp-tRNA(Asn)/Glu-tRNA(Gln) amidotransferase subunit GatB [Spirochaetaceae bacterium]|nr:MAG: Asp-tRNA(Asn)/Glu-tRNA(Gln) amidotransferase subunit GatB [Spirochaetaceae bacterium]